MKAVISKHPRVITAVLFALLFVAGLLTCGDYGAYFDEHSEEIILRQNLMEYTVNLLGNDSEPAQYYKSIGILRVTKTSEIDHGQAAFYPLAPFMTLMDTNLPLLSVLWHIMAWLWFMAGTLALYGLCRKMGLGRVAAFAGAMLLYLCPRFFAEGHYNNKDMVLLSLSLLTMYTGVELWQKPTFWRALLFSLVGALCANTKIVGVCVWGLMGVGAVVLLSAQKRWNRQAVVSAVAAVLSFALFYFLLTPAMWSDPAHYFSYLLTNATGFTRWDNYVLFRSMMYRHSVNPLPFYYLPYMMVVTTPLYVIALCAVGQLAALRLFWQSRKTLLKEPTPVLLLCSTLLWLLPLGFAMVSNPVVYNSWRHLYFIFAGLAVLGAWGLETLIRFMRAHAKKWQQTTAVVLASLCFLTNATGIAMNHPYQYAYYNVVGSMLCPTDLQTGMELDYWGISGRDVLQDAVAQLERPSTLTTYDEVSYLSLENTLYVLNEQERDKLILVDSPHAGLVYINPTYNFMYGHEVPENYRLISEIRSYGNIIAQVYQRVD